MGSDKFYVKRLTFLFFITSCFSYLLLWCAIRSLESIIPSFLSSCLGQTSARFVSTKSSPSLLVMKKRDQNVYPCPRNRERKNRVKNLLTLIRSVVGNSDNRYDF